MNNIDCIIWDWNGTIVDDAWASLECVNSMLRKRNMKEIDLVTYKSYVDSPISKFYENLFDLSKITFETIAKEYNETYDSLEDKITLTKGVRETLGYFKKCETKMIIISASHRSYIERISEKLCVKDYFDAVIAADDFAVGSKIDRAKEYFSKSGLCPSACLVIGDTRHDFEMSRSLGTKCLLLTSGHENRMNLESTLAPVSDEISPDVIEKQFE